MYPIVQQLRRRMGDWFLGALLVIGFAAYLVGSLRPPGDSRFVIQNLFLVTWWQWGLGVILADIYVRGSAASSMRALVFPGSIWVWGALSLAIAYVDPTLAGVHVRPWIAPVLCAAVLLSAAIGHARERRARPLEWMGEFSYSLYLIHPVALAVRIRVLPAGTIPGVLAFVVDIAAALALSRGFFYLVERHFLNTPPGGVPK